MLTSRRSKRWGQQTDNTNLELPRRILSGNARIFPKKVQLSRIYLHVIPYFYRKLFIVTFCEGFKKFTQVVNFRSVAAQLEPTNATFIEKATTE